MRAIRLIIIVSAIFQVNVLHAASLEKAKMYVQNGLLDEAKKELIDVVYSNSVSTVDKATALYTLAQINTRQGDSVAASKTLAKLVHDYPSSPEAKETQIPRVSKREDNGEQARNAANSSSNPSAGIIHLLSRGTEPRYQLRYSQVAMEKSQVSVRVAMLDSDCPTRPAETRYKSADMIIEVMAAPLPDSTDESLHVGLGMTMNGSVPNKDGVPERMEPESMDGAIRLLPSGQIVSELPAEDEKLDAFQTFSSQFPTVSVGAGAQWEMSATTKLDEYPINLRTTYTVVSITAGQAELRIHADLSGSYVDGAKSIKISGGGEGNIGWASGRFLPTNMSFTSFMRMVGTDNGENVPGQVACILLTVDAGPMDIHQDRPDGALEHAPDDEVVTLVDRDNLGKYWKLAVDTPDSSDIGGIDGPYCIAVGFTIGKDGVAANPYVMYAHANVGDGVRDRAVKNWSSYVRNLRFVPADGGTKGTPVFTYGIFGRYQYRWGQNEARKHAREYGEGQSCDQAAKTAIEALRARSR